MSSIYPLGESRRNAMCRDQRWLDQVGTWASVACALHCAALPVLIGLLPALGLELFDSVRFDEAFALFAVSFGGWVVGRGYAHHRSMAVVGLYAIAVVCLLTGAFLAVDNYTRPLLLVAGGVCMALSHWHNRRRQASVVAS